MGVLTHPSSLVALPRATRRRHRVLRAVLRNPPFLLGLLILFTAVGIAVFAG